MYSQQSAVAAVYATTYVEDYVDAVTDVPDDLQKHLSRLKEYDAECNRHVKEAERLLDMLTTLKEKKNDPDAEAASIAITSMVETLLLRTQEIGDQKLEIVQQIQDILENKTAQLDLDQKNSGIEHVKVKHEPVEPTTIVETSEKKRARRPRNDVFVPPSLGPTASETTSHADQPSIDIKPFNAMPPTSSTSHAAGNSSQHYIPPAKAGPSSACNVDKSHEKERVSWGSHKERVLANASAAVAKVKQEKKTADAEKKRQYRRQKTNTKQTGSSNSPPTNTPIDPDEPTYCLCDQISYGDMIGCDNDLCPIEWFHFSCVSLTTKPKGKWFCPKCRGERATIMKPKALFLRELEKYNREREEKA